MIAIFWGSQVPYKLLKQCSVFGRVRIMTRPMWPVVVECIRVLDTLSKTWIHSHPMWPAVIRPPEDGNHLPKHVRVEFGMH
jgi:hypothetical protein